MKKIQESKWFSWLAKGTQWGQENSNLERHQRDLMVRFWISVMGTEVYENSMRNWAAYRGKASGMINKVGSWSLEIEL